MAALTADITLTDQWVQISSAKATVIISNKLPLAINYAVAATTGDLAGVTGHELNRLQVIGLYNLGTNNVFAKTANVGGGGIIAVSAF